MIVVPHAEPLLDDVAAHRVQPRAIQRLAASTRRSLQLARWARKPRDPTGAGRGRRELLAEESSTASERGIPKGSCVALENQRSAILQRAEEEQPEESREAARDAGGSSFPFLGGLAGLAAWRPLPRVSRIVDPLIQNASRTSRLPARGPSAGRTSNRGAAWPWPRTPTGASPEWSPTTSQIPVAARTAPTPVKIQPSFAACDALLLSLHASAAGWCGSGWRTRRSRARDVVPMPGRSSSCPRATASPRCPPPRGSRRPTTTVE